MALRELNIKVTLRDEASRPLREIDKEVDKTKSGFASLGSTLAAIGFGAIMTGFAVKAIDASNRAENALIGFRTVVKNTLGIGAIEETTKGIDNLYQKLGGSMDMSSIQMSVKNLLNSGFSAQQAIDLVEKNAYMASVNRQGQFKTISEAVQVYTEGIKNNNAMLTDSTGISENLSVTLKKKGLSMDDLNNSTKRALVLQTIYNSHTKEAGAYQEAYNQQMEGYQGQVIKADASMTKILETTGNYIKLGLTPLMDISNKVLSFFSESEIGMNRLKIATIFLSTAIGVGLVVATYSWATSLSAASIAAFIAFGWMLATTAAIAAAVTAVYLVLEDLFIFAKYGISGSDTVFGKWLVSMGVAPEVIDKIRERIMAFFDFFVSAFWICIDVLKFFWDAGVSAFNAVSTAIKFFWDIGVMAFEYINKVIDVIRNNKAFQMLVSILTNIGKIIWNIGTIFLYIGQIIFNVLRFVGGLIYDYWLKPLIDVNMFIVGTILGVLVTLGSFIYDYLILPFIQVGAVIAEYLIDKFLEFYNWFYMVFEKITATIGNVLKYIAEITGKPINSSVNVTENVQRNVSESKVPANAESTVNGISEFFGLEKRARGGPVADGQSVIVGDGGEPEVFTAGASGFVTPVSKMTEGASSSGSKPITITLSFNGDMNFTGANGKENAMQFTEKLSEMLDAIAPALAARMGVT